MADKVPVSGRRILPALLNKFKNRVFTLNIRQAAASELVEKHGLDPSEAREVVNQVDDDVVAHAAVASGVAPPKGPILDFIRNLTPEQKAKIIQFILAALGFII